MNVCLQKGYHPKPWRKAVAVALKKPSKPDYSNPRAYRLITLLDCLGKVLERIIARRLTFLTGKHNLVPPNQFGGRSSSSTSDAIITFINDVQAAWNHGKVTSALTFDIKGYFDFVDHKRLLHQLRRKKVPIEYVKWVNSFLSERQAAICIDGIRGEMKPVQSGIPQGSPVSPVLAAFYTAELVEKFRIDNTQLEDDDNSTTPSAPTLTSVIMYVDDGKIYVSSKSLETNVILLKLAYKEVEEWLATAGLSADVTKREIMHYSRRPKYDCAPPITFQDSDGVVRTVTPQKAVKWLGVYFDRRLRFEHHAKQLAAKGENAVNGLTMLANTVRGLDQALVRRLYLACVVPKILYACPAWWNGCGYQVKPLEKVQRRALRLICAAFKTTPTYALEIEASVPPIKHQVDLISRRCAVRFNKLPSTSPIIQRLPDTWRGNQPPTAPPPLPQSPKNQNRTKTVLQNLAKNTSPVHERIDPFLAPPWERMTSVFPNRFTTNPCNPNAGNKTAKKDHLKLVQSLKNKPSAIYVYTDGSKVQRPPFVRVGAAAVTYSEDQEVAQGKVGLGGHAEVFDAEMAALALGATQAAEYVATHPNVTHIAFFADNSAAIVAARSVRPQAAQIFAAKFHNTMTPLLNAHPDLTVNISWCPSHCGIKGNERADELAKEATRLERQTPFSATRSNTLRRAKTSILKLWTKEWKKQPLAGRYAVSNRFLPSLRPTPHLTQLKYNRELFGRLIQCRTGHGYTGEFRQTFLPHLNEPTSCPCDNVTHQTREHILRECERYSQHREVLKKVSNTISLPDVLGSREGIQALAEFLKKSGAFTQSGTPRQPPQPPTPEDEPDSDTESAYSHPEDTDEDPA
jgi:ribonuclease HI